MSSRGEDRIQQEKFVYEQWKRGAKRSVMSKLRLLEDDDEDDNVVELGDFYDLETSNSKEKQSSRIFRTVVEFKLREELKSLRTLSPYPEDIERFLNDPNFYFIKHSQIGKMKGSRRTISEFLKHLGVKCDKFKTDLWCAYKNSKVLYGQVRKAHLSTRSHRDDLRVFLERNFDISKVKSILKPYLEPHRGEFLDCGAKKHLVSIMKNKLLGKDSYLSRRLIELTNIDEFKRKYQKYHIYDLCTRDDNNVEVMFTVPTEVMLNILKYLPKNQSFLNTIGLVNEQFYYLALQSFTDLLQLNGRTILDIPIMLLRFAEKIELLESDFHRVDFEFMFKNIPKLRELVVTESSYNSFIVSMRSLTFQEPLPKLYKLVILEGSLLSSRGFRHYSYGVTNISRTMIHLFHNPSFKLLKKLDFTFYEWTILNLQKHVYHADFDKFLMIKSGSIGDFRNFLKQVNAHEALRVVVLRKFVLGLVPYLEEDMNQFETVKMEEYQGKEGMGLKTRMGLMGQQKKYTDKRERRRRYNSTKKGVVVLMRKDYLLVLRMKKLNEKLSFNPAAIISVSPKCASCGKHSGTTTKLKLCSRCQNVYYCSRACQIKDWKEGHKKNCRKR